MKKKCSTRLFTAVVTVADNVITLAPINYGMSGPKNMINLGVRHIFWNN